MQLDSTSIQCFGYLCLSFARALSLSLPLPVAIEIFHALYTVFIIPLTLLHSNALRHPDDFNMLHQMQQHFWRCIEFTLFVRTIYNVWRRKTAPKLQSSKPRK